MVVCSAVISFLEGASRWVTEPKRTKTLHKIICLNATMTLFYPRVPVCRATTVNWSMCRVPTTSSKKFANFMSKDSAQKGRAAHTCTISFTVTAGTSSGRVKSKDSRFIANCGISDFLYWPSQSFPCKFFHRTGNCNQGADCRFSHEPLSEVTARLLEEVSPVVKSYECDVLVVCLCWNSLHMSYCRQ